MKTAITEKLNQFYSTIKYLIKILDTNKAEAKSCTNCYFFLTLIISVSIEKVDQLKDDSYNACVKYYFYKC